MEFNRDTNQTFRILKTCSSKVFKILKTIFAPYNRESLTQLKYRIFMEFEFFFSLEAFKFQKGL